MATIQTGAGGSCARRPVDSEIPLIPFIDLLLCCVMFLLVTAVWSQISSVQVHQDTGGGTEDSPVVTAEEKLLLQLGESGFVLASTAGDRVEIPARDGHLDLHSLERSLSARHQALGSRAVVMVPDDDIDFDQVIAAMDVVVGSGFGNVSLSTGGDL